MLKNPEDDGLGGGKDEGEDPGNHNHHPGPLPLLAKIEGCERITNADIPNIRNFKSSYVFKFSNRNASKNGKLVEGCGYKIS